MAGSGDVIGSGIDSMTSLFIVVSGAGASTPLGTAASGGSSASFIKNSAPASKPYFCNVLAVLIVLSCIEAYICSKVILLSNLYNSSIIWETFPEGIILWYLSKSFHKERNLDFICILYCFACSNSCSLLVIGAWRSITSGNWLDLFFGSSKCCGNLRSV